MARVASVMALSATGCMAFTAPAERPVTVSLRASAANTAAQPSAGSAGFLGCAAVAAAAGVVASTRSRHTARKGVVGVCLPLTDKFDPLNLGNTDAKMDRYTAVEIKHGRVAMIATVGYIMPEIFRFPGCEAFSHGLGAFESIPLEGWVQLVALVGAHEVLVKPRAGGLGTSDFGLGTELLDGIEEPELERKLTAERNNGRLAMVAIMGLMVQDGMFGEPPLSYMSKNGWWGEGVQYFVQHLNNCQSFSGSFVDNAGVCALPSRGGRTALRATKLSEGPFIETETYPAPKEMEMSAAVPFLRYPQVLKGWVGEEKGFDPLGVTDALPVYWVREAELKHGRVAMLATVGWIATDMGMRVPGEAFQISTVEAHDAMVKFGSMPQMLVWMGYAELFGFLAIVNMFEGKTDRKPGDFGLRGFYPQDAKGQYDMQVKELRNGRLAMLAYGGIVTTAVLTQEKWPFFDAVVNAVPDSKQVRAPATFCGGAAPRSVSRTACHASSSKSLPFLPKPQNLGGLVGGEAEFDPLGFSDLIDIKWLRESELKHGRVCMLATIGFVAEQYWQLPGFDAAPDALQAIYVAPANATGVLLFLAGYIESSSYGGKITMLDMFEGDGASRAPGDLDFGKRFLPQDKAAADDLALKELTNGRLAMLAFSGMVHHNLIVKGPLFPLFPEGYTGPQGSWDLDSVAGALNSGRMGL
mmetsp:Transcript_44172/g.105189  ORF Transcript_44172/g.105189 Transcript_44172/m.105189 type:complete len:696 (-) Transcript_44172:111-2198(-)